MNDSTNDIKDVKRIVYIGIRATKKVPKKIDDRVRFHGIFFNIWPAKETVLLLMENISRIEKQWSLIGNTPLWHYSECRQCSIVTHIMEAFRNAFTDCIIRPLPVSHSPTMFRW